jgi:hypothetical protein
MPLSQKADNARKRRSYKLKTAEQHAHTALLRAQHRAKITPEQRAHQSTLRAQRREKQRQVAITSSWWSTLPLTKPLPYIQTWLPPCLHCGVRRLANEAPGFCCQKGKILAPPLKPLPPEIQELIDSHPSQIARLSRKLNNLFCLAVMGVSGGFEHFEGVGAQTVTITGMMHEFIYLFIAKPNNMIIGRTYHRILPSERPDHAIHWFLFDAQEDQDAAGRRQSIPLSVIETFRNALLLHNQYYKLLGQFRRFANNQPAYLQLKEHTADGEIGAIMQTTTTSANVGRRSVYIYHNADSKPIPISILSRHYEPLQYPLLFFHGEVGWHPFNSKGYTQLRWYRARLLQQASRFSAFSRLHCEYICDMYSRVEDQRLDYIRKARNKQLADEKFCKTNIPLEDSDNPDSGEELESATELPSSFLGSWRYKRDNTADALALARRRGRPSFFLTATTNPKWPEIVSQLAPGQSAYDAPELVCRVFHARLKGLLARLRKSFGHTKYIIRVTEFQKRGLPHAHIIITVSANLILYIFDI